MSEPTRLNCELETTMSAEGVQKEAAASMWYFSPVAGSLSGRGWYCARAGAATSSTAAAYAYRRAERGIAIPQLSPEKGARPAGKGWLRIAQSVVSYQLSAISCRLSVVSYQL